MKNNFFKDNNRRVGCNITDSQVHVWVVFSGLDLGNERMINCLSYFEKARSDGFLLESVRAIFIRSRFCLRVTLSYYLGLHHSEICFSYNKHGKSKVSPSVASSIPIKFNVSHSNELTLLVFHLVYEIGVGVEYMEDHKVSDMLNDSNILNFQEIKLISSQVPENKERLFYKLWTCKEACLKALGEGLSLPLNDVKIDMNLDKALIITRDKYKSTFSFFKNEQCVLRDVEFLPKDCIGIIAFLGDSPNIDVIYQTRFYKKHCERFLIVVIVVRIYEFAVDKENKIT